MASSRGVVRFRRLVLLLVVSLGGACRAREAPLPLPPARIAAGAGSRRAPERHGLSLDFYARSCPAVEQIVGNVTAARFRDHPAAGPAVLRLFYHDCFVEGCDASILIAPTAKAGDAAAARPACSIPLAAMIGSVRIQPPCRVLQGKKEETEMKTRERGDFVFEFVSSNLTCPDTGLRLITCRDSTHTRPTVTGGYPHTPTQPRRHQLPHFAPRRLHTRLRRVLGHDRFPSMRTDLSPSQYSRKFGLQRLPVLPCSRIFGYICPLDQHLGQSSITSLD